MERGRQRPTPRLHGKPTIRAGPDDFAAPRWRGRQKLPKCRLRRRPPRERRRIGNGYEDSRTRTVRRQRLPVRYLGQGTWSRSAGRSANRGTSALWFAFSSRRLRKRRRVQTRSRIGRLRYHQTREYPLAAFWSVEKIHRTGTPYATMLTMPNMRSTTKKAAMAHVHDRTVTVLTFPSVVQIRNEEVPES